jgi:hypothetical protein
MPEQQRCAALHRHPELLAFTCLDEASLVEALQASRIGIVPPAVVGQFQQRT